MNEPKIFYLCETNWDWELGETDVDTYPSLEYMLEEVKCAESCGVVKVTLNTDGTWTKELVLKGTMFDGE